MPKFTEKEIKDLRGVEIILHYDQGWVGYTPSMECPAYVIEAELGKGITIMGPHPADPEEEVQLACYNVKIHSDEVLAHFVKCIKAGEYHPYKPEDYHGASGMSTCAFA